MRFIKFLFLTLILLAPLGGSARGQTSDISARVHAKVHSGALVLTTGDDWSGASLGATVLYNLHPKLSLLGGYDHGFALNDVDNDHDFWRAVASVPVHPSAFVGFGYGWFGGGLEGGVTQLLVFKPVMRRLDIVGTYAHVFARGEVEDFEYARVFLNYHLIGKE